MLLHFQVSLVALRSSAVRMFLFSFDLCAAWLACLSCGGRWIASKRTRNRERITSIVACMHFATEWSDYALRWHIIWFARALHDDDDKTQKTWLPYSMQKKKHNKYKKQQQQQRRKTATPYMLENHMGSCDCVSLLHGTCALGYCRFYVNAMLFLLPAYFLSCLFSFRLNANTVQSRELSDFPFFFSLLLLVFISLFTSLQLDSNWICTFCHFISY